MGRCFFACHAEDMLLTCLAAVERGTHVLKALDTKHRSLLIHTHFHLCEPFEITRVQSLLAWFILTQGVKSRGQDGE